jgi:hypothetical protein
MEEEKKKPTFDELMKAFIRDQSSDTEKPEVSTEVLVMLMSLYEQNQQSLERQDEILYSLSKLIDKEPVEIVNKEVKFPSVIDVEVINPIEEVSVKKPEWLPDFKKHFDTLSSENTKGQFAIIDAIERLTEFLQGIDWEGLKKKSVSDFGGSITPRWYKETPAGSIDGSNRTFSLSTTPKPDNLFLFLGGILQTEGEDYTINRNIITYNNAPPTGVTPHQARFQV